MSSLMRRLLSRDLEEVGGQALQIPGLEYFLKADGRASAKALSWESAWHALGSEGTPVWEKQRGKEVMVPVSKLT